MLSCPVAIPVASEPGKARVEPLPQFRFRIGASPSLDAAPTATISGLPLLQPHHVAHLSLNVGAISSGSIETGMTNRSRFGKKSGAYYVQKNWGRSMGKKTDKLIADLDRDLKVVTGVSEKIRIACAKAKFTWDSAHDKPSYEGSTSGHSYGGMAKELAGGLPKAKQKQQAFKAIFAEHGKNYVAALSSVEKALTALSTLVSEKEKKLSSKVAKAVGWKPESVKRAKQFVKSATSTLNELKTAIKRFASEADEGVFAAEFGRKIVAMQKEGEQLKKSVASETD